MKHEKKEEILRNVSKLIYEAGKLISNYRKEILSIHGKSGNPRDLVTDADKASQKLICSALRENFPDMQIIAEEGSGEIINVDPKILTWIIDPLDGTTNFAKRIPLYAISIALCQYNESIVAVVLELPGENTFFGIRKKMAIMFEGKLHLNLAVSQCDNIQSASIAFDYPKLDERRRIIENAIFNLMKKTDHTRELGSAVLALCYVAAGILDGYINAQLYPWDVAAAKLFIEQAGGKVTNEKGEPWTFADRCCIASNGKIHDQLVCEFQNAL
ncbi:MAG: inositol monophosphatase family protein [Patescibacteria group bacterium]